MREIAVYGKGGIGKSTMSANISAALAVKGQKILQIGCDPKHDSTRLLMSGKRITTVLDYIKETAPLDYRLEDILHIGYQGIGCIEAGGPKPGVGCAGRGIITAFELLEKFHIKDRYDMVLYDVLGDVVCGGFAVPIRREYADTIFLVTSGEYMALYAANNILRGIQNYDDDRCRVAGILYNSRNVKDEDVRVQRFAEAVNLPVFAKIPRDDLFAKAEKRNCTVVEMRSETESLVPDIFMDIADRIIQGISVYPARPLSDEELESLIFYGTYPEDRVKITGIFPEKETQEAEEPQETGESVYDSGYLSKNVIRNEPLHGCAYNGAMGIVINLKDAIVLSHGPKSCAFLAFQTISSTGRRRLFERGVLIPSSLSPNLLSTEMDESDMVFGGIDKLMDKVKQAIARKPKAVVVVSTCPSGIIGDDIDKVKNLSTDEIPVLPIKTDGNLSGDYMQGMLMAYTQLAKQMIDPNVKAQPNVVNIVFEKVVAKNTESNFKLISGWLSQMGIQVNCRFLCDTTCETLKKFCSASLNLLAYQDYTGKLLKDFFEKEYGCEFYGEQFPVGFLETERWLKCIGRYFGKEKTAEEIIACNRKEYEDRVNAVSSKMTGKKLMIVTYNHDVDWILGAALDTGMVISRIGIQNFSQDEGFRSSLDQIADIPVEDNYDMRKLQEEINYYQPDVLLLDYSTKIHDYHGLIDTIPMCPDNGFFSGILMIERWERMLGSDLNGEGEWKNDRRLFEKYFTR